MTHTVGQLVNHKKFGLGKVVGVNGDSVTVFFKSQSEKPRDMIDIQSFIYVTGENSYA